MTYQIYQNCTEADWRFMKEKLKELNKKILELYSESLRIHESPKNADYLALNYTVVNDQKYLSNLAIIFIDEPGIFTFDTTMAGSLLNAPKFLQIRRAY